MGKSRSKIAADHAMQLVDYFERAHVASAAFRGEFDRVLGATNPLQRVMGYWYKSHCRDSTIPDQLLPSPRRPRRRLITHNQ